MKATEERTSKISM